MTLSRILPITINTGTVPTISGNTVLTTQLAAVPPKKKLKIWVVNDRGDYFEFGAPAQVKPLEMIGLSQFMTLIPVYQMSPKGYNEIHWSEMIKHLGIERFFSAVPATGLGNPADPEELIITLRDPK